MPTRKQRARRAKTFRHDYGFVDYDEEGNEVELTGSDLRSKKPEAGKAASKSTRGSTAKGKSGSRSPRAPQPPTWERALKRGGLYGAGTLLLSVFLLQGVTLTARILIGVVYAAMFIPLTYWLDGIIYRRYEKRQSAKPSSRSGRPG